MQRQITCPKIHSKVVMSYPSYPQAISVNILESLNRKTLSVKTFWHCRVYLLLSKFPYLRYS